MAGLKNMRNDVRQRFLQLDRIDREIISLFLVKEFESSFSL